MAFLSQLVFVLVLMVSVHAAHVTLRQRSYERHWDYGKTGNGPEYWHEFSEHCAKSHQSPINIIPSKVQKNPGLKGLSITSDNINGKVSGKLINNGHAPSFSIDKSKGTASLTGGPLGDSLYELEQLHIHFGCEDHEGSEHTVNGETYSGELHLVTYNTKYANFKTAADKPDGLSVIGVFLQEDDDDGNQELQKLSENILDITEADSEKQVNQMLLYKLVPELKDLSKATFFSYKGSLTTPPCYQSVRWIVLKNPIAASEDDLKNMRRLQDHKKNSICNNFRPIKPLNGRPVSEYSA